MIFIDNEGVTNPHLNLALEEYALRNLDYSHDYLLFYINDPSIIIGRNQNTLEEINHEYVEQEDIYVVRRISGGGAVYHDTGNLNFSFITDYDKKHLNNFRKFTDPVIRVLESMGVNAALSGRNDIQVDGRKISGNAQFSSVKRMFSHGTLLFDSDLSEVTNALDVKMSKIQSKGHKSVRSRVANISEFLDEPMPVTVFREKLLEGLYEYRDDFETYQLTEKEWAEVHELKNEKYDQWDWNFGKSPKFNIKRSRRFEAGEIDLRLDVEKGHIENVKIYGDFFGKEPVEQLEDHLQGARYDREEVEELLSPIDIEGYFGSVPKEEFIELVYGADE
ncbi:lipoate--protein ligase [Fodinibius halophilus]|uniref:lipoate--protein ligase n=1 Tax=Fodinibius halophilus TaxID=1736908 RepID=A0A6M1SZV3_9BACT|nr:lipoate--protein ligase [Fodinibius halophilus]NGP88796.1 lipoate--protein ligase [Fodinibius halophilus]